MELVESLASFVRMARDNGHQLIYHPASEEDIARDRDQARRQRTLSRLRQFSPLEETVSCPWNTVTTSENDAVDNRILYAISLDAADILLTEDRGIHNKAVGHALADRVLTIQAGEDLLRRLHLRIAVKLPNIEDVPLYSLTPLLGSEFFDSLRSSYPLFDDWFRRKARGNERAWVAFNGETREIGGLCVYVRQENERLTEEGLVIPGTALKLATFKVGASFRGRKIGELFLKAAFRYATANQIERIFIHGDKEQHYFLFQMLVDFGFYEAGTHPGSEGRDAVHLKDHPVNPPSVDLPPFDFNRRYFPHFRHDSLVSKYIVPIKPEYHEMLFPDYAPIQQRLSFENATESVGNAIKLAYLCYAQTASIRPGDVVMFYRSGDERTLASLAIVENYEQLDSADAIARRVKRRTVYSLSEIVEMVESKSVEVMLFRLVRHATIPLSCRDLIQRFILKGPPQSITKLSNENFERIIQYWQ